VSATNLPVVIAAVSENGFRARSGEPLPLSADGATPRDALENLRQALEERLQNGTQLTSIQVGLANPKLLQGAGIYREDDPIVQEWLQIMKENREKAEEDPNYL